MTEHNENHREPFGEINPGDSFRHLNITLSKFFYAQKFFNTGSRPNFFATNNGIKTPAAVTKKITAVSVKIFSAGKFSASTIIS